MLHGVKHCMDCLCVNSWMNQVLCMLRLPNWHYWLCSVVNEHEIWTLILSTNWKVWAMIMTMSWPCSFLLLQIWQQCFMEEIVMICTLFYLFSHTYASSDSFLSWPCTIFSHLCFLWLISLMTVYNILTLILPLTHFPHNCVHLSHAYSTMTHKPLSQISIYRTSYLLQILNLALLKYTWVSGQVPLGTFVLISLVEI